jgi:antitoxin component YwqK of YwqJK toxin-antitoxin module
MTTYSQLKIKGEFIDSYGEKTLTKIDKKSGEMFYDFDNETFTVETTQKSRIEILFENLDGFKIKYILKNVDNGYDLGKVHLIENRNWFDGPKNGIITRKYNSGKIQYKREIRNWKLNGFSEFFNKKGKLTQKVVFKRGIPIKIHILENGIMKELNYEFDKKTRTIVITVPNNS